MKNGNSVGKELQKEGGWVPGTPQKPNHNSAGYYLEGGKGGESSIIDGVNKSFGFTIRGNSGIDILDSTSAEFQTSGSSILEGVVGGISTSFYSASHSQIHGSSNTCGYFGKTGNEGSKLHTNENLEDDIGSTYFIASTPPERRTNGVGVNKKLRRRVKMTKHRPKVLLVEGQPKKTPKPSTSKLETPKNLTPDGKREYIRKNSTRTLDNMSEFVDEKAFDKNPQCAVRSCRRTLNFNLEKLVSNEDHDTVKENSYDKQVPSFNLENRYLNATTISYENVDGHDARADKSSCNLDLNLKLKPLCKPLRENQCLHNSRKLELNFPIICKKRRMRRQKAIISKASWFVKAADDGVKEQGRRRVTMRNKFVGMIAPTKRQTREAIDDSESLQHLLALSPLVKYKRKRSKGLIQKHKLASPMSNLALEEQNKTAIIDAESFKYTLIMWPEKFKKKRSKRSKRLIQKPTVNCCNSKCEDIMCTSRSDDVVPEIERCLPQLNDVALDIEGSPPVVNCRPLQCEDVMCPPRSDDVVPEIEYSPQQNGTLVIERCHPLFNDVFLTQESSQDTFVKEWIDFVIEKFECLDINEEYGQLVVSEKKPDNALVPYKKHKSPPKVDLDSETMRVWKLLMENGGATVGDEADKDKEKWWEEERGIFRGRVDSFIARMHLIQGNRRFSPWKGSVVDSVVGVFLTQNVSDYLSSNAFMALASRFPLHPTSNHRECVNEEEIFGSQESVGSNIVADKKMSCDESLINSNIGSRGMENERESSRIDRLSELKGSDESVCLSSCHEFYSEVLHAPSDLVVDTFDLKREFRIGKTIDGGEICKNQGHVEVSGSETSIQQNANPRAQEATTVDRYAALGKFQVSPNCSLRAEVMTRKMLLASNNPYAQKKMISKSETASRRRKNKIEEKQGNTVDWDDLRKTYCKCKTRETAGKTMDSVDWERVRHATVEEISKTIHERGMHILLAERIKYFLNRVVKDHGKLDLEWLRDVPPEKAKDYLLSMYGLGLKSVECVRLLTLHHHAFPVDTNVGRIAVRLGWVPLQPLPESVQIHLLNQYPLMDSIQKYLWPRLCTLDQRTLYELHYQMITFGKVFCTKLQPNCNACPMKGECRHFASSFASAKLALPAPQEKSNVISEFPVTAVKNPAMLITTAPHSLPDVTCSESRCRSQNCEPIVEVPASPMTEPTESLVRDIEDFYYDSEEVYTLKLNAEESKETSLDYMNKILQEGEMSNALAVLTAEAASIPLPKLKHMSRLRTRHLVYELPDSHPLLKRLDKRDPDDPCPYLLAVWTIGETVKSSEQPKRKCNSQESGLCDKTFCICNNIQEDNGQTISGTILMPCRTANGGSFPLNGTYFQVNEVFADDESSECPIDVPREWIWNLPRRMLYCGTSTTSIFRGLSTDEIHYCFWRGFVCVRGFNRTTGVPRRIPKRFHLSIGAAGKTKTTNGE